MGVDLSSVDLVSVELILVGLNTVEVNVVDIILCWPYSVGPFMPSRRHVLKVLFTVAPLGPKYAAWNSRFVSLAAA